jgi:type III pantothenate kinase
MARLLLIGNSRWHWGEWHPNGLQRQWDCSPEDGFNQWQQQRAELWAAVGPVPQGLAADQACRVGASHIPLASQSEGLGVDRALAAWEAWMQAGACRPVCVADAGTALSLTLADREGRFLGGRLSAGAALQFQALHQGTEALPALRPPSQFDPGELPGEAWPRSTAAAMAAGVLQGLAGAILHGYGQLPEQGQTWQLWLTGGDGAALETLLRLRGLEPCYAQNLGLQGLGRLWQIRGLNQGR